MDKKNLLFVCYAQQDSAWAIDVLEPHLGGLSGRLVTERDFEPGSITVEAIDEAIRDSEYVLLLISDAFFADEWTTHVMQQVAHETVTSGRSKFLWMKIGECSTKTPPTYIDSHKGFDATADRAGALEALRVFLKQPKTLRSAPPVPYMGMRPYTSKHAHLFTARETEVIALLRDMRSGYRYICVWGPSGSGKSSLVGAGLLPRLADSPLLDGKKWRIIEMRPGKTPASRLSKLLGGNSNDSIDKRIDDFLAREPGKDSLFLWIDQLEEVFAQADEDERNRFYTMMRDVRLVPNCVVVFTIRSDYDQELTTCPLALKQCDKRVYVDPLQGPLLRKALTKPAADCNVYLEPQLVDRILSDAAGAHEPGVLPLMQETMVLLWERWTDSGIRLADYEALGSATENGLAVAIGSRADGVYDRLDPQQKVLARRILLRLVQFGEGRLDTRRQLSEDMLGAQDASDADVKSVLEVLIANRLLTASDAPKSLEANNKLRLIDISHEILIQSWPLLRSWITQMKECEKVRRRLEQRAMLWARDGGRQGGLDKFELADAQRWLRTPEAQELGASDTLHELIESSAKTNRARTLVGLSIVAAIAVLCGLLVVMYQKYLNEKRERVASAYAGKAADAIRLAQRPGYSIDALEQALRSVELYVPKSPSLAADKNPDETPDVVNNAMVSALMSARRDMNPLPMPFHPGLGTHVLFTPDGSKLIGFSHWSMFEWDVSSRRIVNVGTQEGITRCIAFATKAQSSEAEFITIDAKGTRYHWNLDGGLKQTVTSEFEPTTFKTEFDSAPLVRCAHDGSSVVSVDTMGVIHRVFPADAKRNLAIPTDLKDATIKRGDLSAEGRWFVVDDEKKHRIWDLEQDPRLVYTRPIVTNPDQPNEDSNNRSGVAAEFLPDDHWAFSSTDGLTTIVSLPRAAESLPIQGRILAASRDGHTLLTQSHNEIALLKMTKLDSNEIWNKAWTHVEAAGNIETKCKAEFYKSEKSIVVACGNGFVSVLRTENGGIQSRTAIDAQEDQERTGIHVAIGGEDKRFATAIGSRIVVWDARSGALLEERTLRPSDSFWVKSSVSGEWANNITFSPNGEKLAIGSASGTYLWSLSASKGIYDAQAPVYSIDISPDGKKIVGGLENGRTIVWDRESGEEIANLYERPATPMETKDSEASGRHVHAVHFMADGREVMAASDDCVIRRWDVATKAVKERVEAPACDYHFFAAVSADETQLVATSNKRPFEGADTYLWKRSGDRFEFVRKFDGSSSPEKLLASHAIFSPDGMEVATAPVTFGTHVQIWQSSTGKPVRELIPQTPNPA